MTRPIWLLYQFFILLSPHSGMWLAHTYSLYWKHSTLTTLCSLSTVCSAESHSNLYNSKNCSKWWWNCQPFLIKRRTWGKGSWLRGFGWSPGTTIPLPMRSSMLAPHSDLGRSGSPVGSQVKGNECANGLSPTLSRRELFIHVNTASMGGCLQTLAILS